MEYPLMVTPFVMLDFKDMNKKQVEEYFNWYMSERENRLNILKEYIYSEGNPGVVFDNTPESLIPLWEWYENKIELVDDTEEDIQKAIAGKPDWMKEIILSNTKDLSIPTMAIGADIGIYYAETMISNVSQIKWGYKMKPPKLDSVRQPVLVGFRNNVDMNPRAIVINCARRSFRERCSTRLYDVYNNNIKNI